MTALAKLFRATAFRLTLVYLLVFALFAAFLLYSAITILAKGSKAEPVGDESSPFVNETSIPPYEPKRYPLGLAASLVAGALSGSGFAAAAMTAGLDPRFEAFPEARGVALACASALAF